MSTSKHSILLLNGSLAGEKGNTSVLLELAARQLAAHAAVHTVALADLENFDSVPKLLGESHGVIFGTGTYWDSWGSPMQRLFEFLTAYEGTAMLLGKPAGVVVTMHSVGGKGVLSRLQGVLNTLGLLIPPMCGVVCSAVNQIALEAEASPLSEDLWRPDDLEVLCHNLLQALSVEKNWKSWPVRRDGVEQKWINLG